MMIQEKYENIDTNLLQEPNHIDSDSDPIGQGCYTFLDRSFKIYSLKLANKNSEFKVWTISNSRYGCPNHLLAKSEWFP